MSVQDQPTSIRSDRAAWLNGPEPSCYLPNGFHRPWRMVLLGAPGVGKGTQAELLWHRLGACHLSTGDVFRHARQHPDCHLSPSMTEALEYMKRGALVPDATVVAMIRERHACLSCRGGFLLDGFPRTVAQAEALQNILEEDGVHLDAVLDYVLPLDQVVARMGGRRTCSGCKAVYHVTGRPPKVPDVCDRCGKPLFQREDDHPDPVRLRMEQYVHSTAPLTDFYQKLGVLILIPADGSPEEIYQRTITQLSDRPELCR